MDANLPQAFGAGLKALWQLDPEVCHLNHGAFGGTPLAVLDAQQAWRNRLEANPSAFFRHEVYTATRQAAETVAAFVGGRGEDWAFVDNATTAANAILGSLGLRPGDEILTSDQAYGAVANAIQHHAKLKGAVTRVFALPCPAREPAEVVAAVTAALRDETRVLVLDHITSPTGLVLPIAEVAKLCRQADIALLADGAHAPGNISFDVTAIDADWYIANLHKWAYAPHGCGVLRAADRRRESLHPTVISWGYGKGFAAEFDWQGTRDPSPWLSAPDGISFGEQLGWDRLRERNHALILESAAELSAALGTESAGPAAMTGAMVAVRLPIKAEADSREQASAMQNRLMAQHRIAVSVTPAAGALWLRLSLQVYNEAADVARLIDALKAEL